MATKKSNGTSKSVNKSGKKPPREPGFFSDYGGTGIVDVKRPGSSTPAKKPGGSKKK